MLHVITVCSNPVRFKSRIRLMRDFIQRMGSTSNVTLYVVEAAFADRPFEVTNRHEPKHHRVRTQDEIWNKEAMINIAISRLPSDAKYVAWIDGDISFVNPDWANETMRALEHYDIVQPWSHAVDLGPLNEIIHTAKAFTAFYQEQNPMVAGSGAYPVGYPHSGYAWAARRDALDHLTTPASNGPLISHAALGSADFYMAWGLIGKLGQNLYNDVANADSRRKGFTRSYIDTLFHWQDKARKLKLNVGNVPGTILHYFHGWKKNRGYNSRENILIKNEFDPFTDLEYDSQGMPRWVLSTPRQIRMRDQVRSYFRSRHEDVIAPD